MHIVQKVSSALHLGSVVILSDLQVDLIDGLDTVIIDSAGGSD